MAKLKELTTYGPDVAIEAVGCHYTKSLVHKVETAIGLETDTGDVINEMIKGVRKVCIPIYWTVYYMRKFSLAVVHSKVSISKYSFLDDEGRLISHNIDSLEHNSFICIRPDSWHTLWHPSYLCLPRLVVQGGRISVVGVYVASINHFMFGPLFEKGLSLKGGQTPCQKYWPKLFELIQTGRIPISL